MREGKPATPTEHPPISWRCEVCEGREDYEGLNGAWKDFELVRGVMRDRRLKPAAIYREVARRLVAPKKLSGRGVGPKIRREANQWLAANAQLYPGLVFRGERNAPAMRIGAGDLFLLLGYASSFLDHAREVQDLGGNIRAHFRKYAKRLPPLSVNTERKLDCVDEAWPRTRKSLSRRVVARELKISVRTINRRLVADPQFQGPSIWGWAAYYHLHSLHRAS